MISLHIVDSHWMVGENFRYHTGFVRAAELIAQDAIGKPVLANWTLHVALNPGDKYYETSWRRAGDFLEASCWMAVSTAQQQSGWS